MLTTDPDLRAALWAALLFVSSAGAALAAPTTADHLNALKARHDALEKMLADHGAGELPDPEAINVPDSVLSTAGLNIHGLAHGANRLERMANRFANDPFAGEDFFTRFAGSTQSETSVAWCGSNAMVGFNDSGSFLATLIGAVGDGSFAFGGFSSSSNAGNTFLDGGPLLSAPHPGADFRDLFGDPAVACSDSSTFYMSQIAVDTVFSPFGVFAGASVSRSIDGGKTFGGAVMAVRKDGFLHEIDKEWMVVVPGKRASSDVVHVTYTDFDFTGFVDPASACPGTLRTAIEYVRSNDAGATWTSPLVIDEVCGLDPAVQGSQVRATAGGTMYVAWERYASFPFGARSIAIRKSTDGGRSFTPATTISSVTAVGDTFLVQGNFRAFIDIQSMAIDQSSGPFAGSVYVSWHDGRNVSRPDVLAGLGVYRFGDAFVSRSRDGGRNWSAPVRINDDPTTLAVDQLFPALTVDRRGNLFAVFHDRRADPRNFLLDTFLARSTNGGVTFTNRRINDRSFPSVVAQDAAVNTQYNGDYISVAADSTGSNPGVISAWNDNSAGDPNAGLSKDFDNVSE